MNQGLFRMEKINTDYKMTNLRCTIHDKALLNLPDFLITFCSVSPKGCKIIPWMSDGLWEMFWISIKDKSLVLSSWDSSLDITTWPGKTCSATPKSCDFCLKAALYLLLVITIFTIEQGRDTSSADVEPGDDRPVATEKWKKKQLSSNFLVTLNPQDSDQWLVAYLI